MNTSIDALSNKRRPLYEVWPGENKFWGKGKYFVG